MALAPALPAYALPPQRLLRSLRPVARGMVRGYLQVRVHGERHVPRHGPVILAANHIGLADGPLLAIFAPRPVHALSKQELFTGRAGGLLAASGQIPLDRTRPDPGAVRSCLAALEAGRCVGIFPEGRRGAGEYDEFHGGVGYLALVSGAPVVPVTFFGTRPPGGGSGAMPGRGARVDMVFGTPYRLEAVPWPRTREQVEQATALLRQHLVGELRHAQQMTGRTLPGPLPAGDSGEDDDIRIPGAQ